MDKLEAWNLIGTLVECLIVDVWWDCSVFHFLGVLHWVESHHSLISWNIRAKWGPNKMHSHSNTPLLWNKAYNVVFFKVKYQRKKAATHIYRLDLIRINGDLHIVEYVGSYFGFEKTMLTIHVKEWIWESHFRARVGFKVVLNKQYECIRIDIKACNWKIM